ncbi:LuxR family transcriptional regulator [Sphingosinicella rhizophila]|uniref:LuxR family transcriptional regulator n=1 Tax=Sphingosinicella rhizophila TaxID=3050082 RepID=A0ABU3Q5B9_9SPHN|nr:LuxR family transcriptional regulator [Sphingosinicella sp. GR2756]MDT9598608.1 LuxR family transcriptional regulator [Sphingosinicella sp. GR2756]
MGRLISMATHGCSDRAIKIAGQFIGALSSVQSEAALRRLMGDVTRDMNFRHFALITHEDLRLRLPGQVDIRDYPEGIADRIIGQGEFRRDPVMRGCAFADSAFIWSDLHRLIVLNRRDLKSLQFGLQEGLDEGVTVPCYKLGQCLGSCTFAGRRKPFPAERALGVAQMIGIFAFQRARQLVGGDQTPAPPPRLNPRPRDCIVLAGRGLTNKQIARSLGLAPRTVDGYLTDARRLFGVTDRMELVTAAIFAGEIGLHEIRKNQSRAFALG